MEEFHIGDMVINTKTNRCGIYKGFSGGHHLPLVKFDGDSEFTELSNSDDLELARKIAKIIFNKSGGTAGKGGITNRITLPTTWVNALGITQENRNVEMTLEGGRIIIKKSEE